MTLEVLSFSHILTLLVCTENFKMLWYDNLCAIQNASSYKLHLYNL